MVHPVEYAQTGWGNSLYATSAWHYEFERETLMTTESYSNGMNRSTDLWIGESGTASTRIKTRTLPAPWEGDWRLSIAEERLAMAEAKLAAAEQRLSVLADSK